MHSLNILSKAQINKVQDVSQKVTLLRPNSITKAMDGLFKYRVITGIFGQWGIIGHFSSSFLTQMRFSDINQALIVQNNQ